MTGPTLAEAWLIVAHHVQPGVFTRRDVLYAENAARALVALDPAHPLAERWRQRGVADAASLKEIVLATIDAVELAELQRPEAVTERCADMRKEAAVLADLLQGYDTSKPAALEAACAITISATALADHAHDLTRALTVAMVRA